MADDEAKSTLVKVGEKAPEFVCKPINGEEVSLSKQHGTVVLVNFFATWCGPCLAELPHLEKEIMKKFGDRPDFKLIVIGREHSAEELQTFAKEKKLTLLMAPDPTRAIYGKFATQYIPRNFIVGKDGKIKLASVGYTDTSFQEIVQTLENELKASAPSVPSTASRASAVAVKQACRGNEPSRDDEIVQQRENGQIDAFPRRAESLVSRITASRSWVDGRTITTKAH